MTKYAADHAGALADLTQAGARVTFAWDVPGAHDPATDTFANGTTTSSAATDTWYTGPTLTAFAPTDVNGQTTATLTSDYPTGVGELVETAVLLRDGRLAVSTVVTP